MVQLCVVGLTRSTLRRRLTEELTNSLNRFPTTAPSQPREDNRLRSRTSSNGDRRRAFINSLPTEIQWLIPGTQHYDEEKVEKLRALRLKNMLMRYIPRDIQRHIPILSGSRGVGNELSQNDADRIARLSPMIQRYIRGSRYYEPEAAGGFDDLKAEDDDIESEVGDALLDYLSDRDNSATRSYVQRIISRLPSSVQKYIPGTQYFDSELAAKIKQEKIKRRLVRNLPEKLKKYAPSSPHYDRNLAESDDIPTEIEELINDLTPEARKYIQGSDSYDPSVAARSDVLRERDEALFQIIQEIPGVSRAIRNNFDLRMILDALRIIPGLQTSSQNSGLGSTLDFLNPLIQQQQRSNPPPVFT